MESLGMMSSAMRYIRIALLYRSACCFPEAAAPACSKRMFPMLARSWPGLLNPFGSRRISS